MRRVSSSRSRKLLLVLSCRSSWMLQVWWWWWWTFQSIFWCLHTRTLHKSDKKPISCISAERLPPPNQMPPMKHIPVLYIFPLILFDKYYYSLRQAYSWSVTLSCQREVTSPNYSYVPSLSRRAEGFPLILFPKDYYSLRQAYSWSVTLSCQREVISPNYSYVPSLSRRAEGRMDVHGCAISYLVLDVPRSVC